MSLIQDIPLILKEYDDSKSRLHHNEKLFEIYEGDLKSHLLHALRGYLSAKSYEQALSHVAPINVLKRLIDKLSKLYAKTPIRKLSEDAAESDQALLDELVKAMDLNTAMGLANEFFNLFKYCAIEPFLDRGKPALRVIPSDRFIVYSTDKVNPMRPTHFSKIMGCQKDETGAERTLFYTYSENEFLIHDDLGKPYPERMAEAGNPEGMNPLGRLPVTYINRSRHDLVPLEDSDTLAMTILIAILLSDLNYALKFQCFSIIYGINVSQEGLAIAPNVFWNLKADATSDQKPELGTIQPTVESDKMLTAIKTQLAFWMQCRNIKPGAIGQMGAESAASGFAKMIDEMDTSEDRQKQVPYFMAAEDDLFDLIKRLQSLVWIHDPEYKLTRQSLSPEVLLNTQFAEQRANVDSSQQLSDEVVKLTNKLTTRKRALKVLNPDLDDDAIDALISEIDEEAQKNIEQAQAHMQAMGMDPASEAQAKGNEGEPKEQDPKASGENPLVKPKSQSLPGVAQ